VDPIESRQPMPSAARGPIPVTGARRILVLFPDEWDRSMAARAAPGHEFLFEGFDLFRFPGNARLFTFDVLRFVERLARRFARSPLDAMAAQDSTPSRGRSGPRGSIFAP